MLVRGRFRVVGPPLLLGRGRRVDGGGPDGGVSVPLLVLVSEVVDGVRGPLMSVVDGGVVLVIVGVVVAVGEWEAVVENDGSTKVTRALGSWRPVT
jgi:hypothetical protein